MSKTRTFNFNLNITATLSVPDEDVQDFIKAVNKQRLSTQTDKRTRAQQAFIKAILGDGVEADGTNFDILFDASIRKGFRDAARNGELNDFSGLTGLQVTCEAVPKAYTLSTPKEQAE